MMDVLRDDSGLCHVISDGPSPTRLYALCDIVAAQAARQRKQDAWDRNGMRATARMSLPTHWGPEDVVQAVPTCLTCVSIVKEAISG